MGADGVNWLPALVALVAGLGLGGLYVWKMRGRGPSLAPFPEVPLDRRDLVGKRDVLLQLLVELDDTAAKRSPEQLARERYALELEAARVLRELDRLPALAPAPSASGTAAGAPGAGATTAAPRAPAPAAHAPAAGHPALRGFLWATGSMAALGGLVFLVTQSARPRQPGETPTGEVPGMSTPAPADPEEASLRVHLEQNPDDLDARLALAQVLLGRQDMMGVWTETQEVLARSPGHPRALAYQALVRLAMGQAEIALEMLEQAIAAEPDLIDAYAPLSLVQMRLGRRDAAERTMAEAKRRFPGQAEALERFQAQLLASVGDGAAILEDDPHAAVPPPGGSAPAVARGTQRPTTGGGPPKGVAGVLDIDPALRGQAGGGVLFLIVRAAGVEGGPPLAVQRLVPSSFPLRFEIGEGDSMTGEPLPDEILVEARLDSDGDPTSRPATDPRARADSVRLGTSDLALLLRQEK